MNLITNRFKYFLYLQLFAFYEFSVCVYLIFSWVLEFLYIKNNVHLQTKKTTFRMGEYLHIKQLTRD